MVRQLKRKMEVMIFLYLFERMKSIMTITRDLRVCSILVQSPSRPNRITSAGLVEVTQPELPQSAVT